MTDRTIPICDSENCGCKPCPICDGPCERDVPKQGDPGGRAGLNYALAILYVLGIVLAACLLHLMGEEKGGWFWPIVWPYVAVVILALVIGDLWDERQLSRGRR